GSQIPFADAGVLDARSLHRCWPILIRIHYLKATAQEGGSSGDRWAFLENRLDVRHAQGRTTPPAIPYPTLRDRAWLNDQRVRAEAGDLGANGRLRPLSNSEHGNHRRYPDDHAQHG